MVQHKIAFPKCPKKYQMCLQGYGNIMVLKFISYIYIYMVYNAQKIGSHYM